MTRYTKSVFINYYINYNHTLLTFKSKQSNHLIHTQHIMNVQLLLFEKFRIEPDLVHLSLDESMDTDRTEIQEGTSDRKPKRNHPVLQITRYKSIPATCTNLVKFIRQIKKRLI